MNAATPLGAWACSVMYLVMAGRLASDAAGDKWWLAAGGVGNGGEFMFSGFMFSGFMFIVGLCLVGLC